jgi:hypothetical protein
MPSRPGSGWKIIGGGDDPGGDEPWDSVPPPSGGPHLNAASLGLNWSLSTAHQQSFLIGRYTFMLYFGEVRGDLSRAGQACTSPVEGDCEAHDAYAAITSVDTG